MFAVSNCAVLKVATPAIAATVKVPDKTPDPVAIAIVILPV